MNKPEILISTTQWKETWAGLKIRGQESREALCVWAGDRKSQPWKVLEVVFLDDFPGVEGFARFHRVSREAVTALFRCLHQKNLQLIADVHSHPGSWVGLSDIDMEHPLEFRVGFLSLVLPSYAIPKPDIGAVGVHEYIGNMEWKTLTAEAVLSRIKIQEVQHANIKN